MPINIDGSKGIRQNTTEVTKIPVGTTAQRPANPEVGMMRFNTDTGQIEGYNIFDNGWQQMSNFFARISATGGTVTDIEQNGRLFRVHTFTSDGTFEVARGGEVEYLVVAGGGGGGGRRGGGGGGGEVNIGTTNLFQGNYSIVVGDGAQDRKGRILGDEGTGDNGENSSAFGITSLGGGGGGGRSPADDGGSGGGEGGLDSSVGISTATTGLGNDGGNSNSTDRSGGGGGGAGSLGSPTGLKESDSDSGGDGGDGISSSISGATTFYGGGGGGGAYSGSSLPGDGGAGGGGIGQQEDPFDSGVNTKHDGLSNTGGGGGGASGSSSHAAAGIGGSGIVIVRYRIG